MARREGYDGLMHNVFQPARFVKAILLDIEVPKIVRSKAKKCYRDATAAPDPAGKDVAEE